ncbi:MAG TPA: helix-turn-helix domain-containing protein, partial [Candidatus Dormibacteraeota bacterium]|nr:helix-turn-helix domain-containing protein [Candidatus Dormibacteraeota bacterium]
MSTVPKRQHSVKLPNGQHTAAGQILTDLIIPVIRLEAQFSRAGEAIAATGGQTLARWLTLEMVADQPATVAQVARNLGLTRQSVQRIADLLEQDGLTEYVENPAHQTSRLVRLSARGR